MRKAERLFQILTLLRSRRTVMTAQQLAEQLQVSERTIYRDMQALSLSGIPLESEAGMGYRLKPSFNIPPLMFTPEELEALLLGARMVQGWSDVRLGDAAENALKKIYAVLPNLLHQQYVQQPEWLLVPDMHRKYCAKYSDVLRAAIKNKQVLFIDYKDAKGAVSQREIWPLGLVFWGSVWTVVAWCQKRDYYRMFRLDRINKLECLERNFTAHDHCNLQHYWSLQCD